MRFLLFNLWSNFLTSGAVLAQKPASQGAACQGYNAQDNENNNGTTPIFWQYPDALQDIAEKQHCHAKANADDTANFAKLCEP
ncbi:MAG: hypothetical protein INF90_05620 [Roseomonas sp.]|nr:hypothetical protein [Roseomonas sp.]